MINTLSNTTLADTNSRDAKMNHLLNQMVSRFRKAFPNAKILAEWLALMNSAIHDDRAAEHADKAAGFTYYLGYDLLPVMIEAKSDDDILLGIKHLFTQSAGTDDLGCIIPFIMYKILNITLGWSGDPEFHKDALRVIHELEKIAILGNEYAELKTEARIERQEAYKKGQN